MSFTFDDTFRQIIQADFATTKTVPLLLGEAGIGKTSFINDLATTMDAHVFTVQVNQLAEKGDLIAVKTLPNADGEGYSQFFFPHHTITEAVRFAEANPEAKVILNFDEYNRSEPDLNSAVMTIATTREVAGRPLPKNVLLIATGNDRGAVTQLDTASTSRFAVYPVAPDTDVFLSLLGNSLHPHILATLKAHPDYILQYPDDEQNSNDMLFAEERIMPTQFTTPRTIDYLSTWLNNINADVLNTMLVTPVIDPDADNTLPSSTMRPDNQLYAALAAHTGHTEFTMSIYLKLREQLLQPTTNSARTEFNPISTDAAYDISPTRTAQRLYDLYHQDRLTETYINDIINDALDARPDADPDEPNVELSHTFAHFLVGANPAMPTLLQNSLLEAIVTTGVAFEPAMYTGIIQVLQTRELSDAAASLMQWIEDRQPDEVHPDVLHWISQNLTLLI